MFGPSRRDLHRMLERERMRNDKRERELLDRIMWLTGRPWGLPENAVDEPEDDPEPMVSALDVLPEDWDGVRSVGALD